MVEGDEDAGSGGGGRSIRRGGRRRWSRWRRPRQQSGLGDGEGVDLAFDEDDGLVDVEAVGVEGVGEAGGPYLGWPAAIWAAVTGRRTLMRQRALPESQGMVMPREVDTLACRRRQAPFGVRLDDLLRVEADVVAAEGFVAEAAIVEVVEGFAPSAPEEDGAAGDVAAAVGLPAGRRSGSALEGWDAQLPGSNLNLGRGGTVFLTGHCQAVSPGSSWGYPEAVTGFEVCEAVAVAEIVDGVAVQVAAAAAGIGAEAGPAFVAVPDAEAVRTSGAGTAMVAEGQGRRIRRRWWPRRGGVGCRGR